MSIPSTSTFPTPADPRRKIIFNRDPLFPVILQTPERHQIHSLIEDVERLYVDSFWAQVLCKPSPYREGIPFGLVSANSGVSLLSTSDVLAQAEKQTGRKSSGSATDYSIDELRAAILALKPKTVNQVNDRLKEHGRSKFMGFSLLDLEDQHTEFTKLVQELIKRGTDGTSFALGALVAMRCKNWLILPIQVNMCIGQAAAVAHSRGKNWANPLNFLSDSLRQLYYELIGTALEPQGNNRAARFDGTKARLAVFCTNLASKQDFSWPLAAELLKKHDGGGQNFDPSAAIRDHWRQMCRVNGPTPESFPAEAAGQKSVILPWQSKEPDETPECRLFTAPDDPKYQVRLNIDNNSPHILSRVGRNELLETMQRVEEEYVAEYWAELCTASPHKVELPYALAGSAMGHTLVQPVAVYEQISGHNDHSNPEAIAELKRYPMTELCKAVQALKPNSVNATLALLTENGRLRFQAFSLVDLGLGEPTFKRCVLSLIGKATASGYQTGKSLAQQALVALRSKGWVILPDSVNHHIGRVLRGVNGTDRSWGTDPMVHLQGEVEQLYRQLVGEVIKEPSHSRSSDDLCICRRAVLCTNVRSTRDLSMPLIDTILATDADTKKKGMAAVASATLRARWQRLCEANGPAAMIPMSTQNDHRSALAKRCPPDERLAEWIEFLAQQAEIHTGGNFEPVYQSYGIWLSWLATLDTLPGPLQVTRKHIRDDANPSANTFRVYLSKLQREVTKNRNMPLAKMNEVFERLSTESEDAGKTFANPIRWQFDRFETPRGESHDGTKRSRIDDWIMAEMKALIVKKTDDGYQWGEDLGKIESLKLETGTGEKTFCPIMPAIIYVMLIFPLRTHQTRWLDSGEMDESIYAFDFQAFVPNSNQKALVGRSCGVLQPSQKKLTNDLNLEFQVAVNKVLLQQRNRSAFTIPYLPPDVLWVIRQVLQWQKEYGPPAHLVKEVHEPNNELRRNQSLASYYPDICPLFRYPLQRAFYPPSHDQISYFWGKLCSVWDNKNQLWRDLKTGLVGPRPATPKLSRTYTRPGGRTKMDVAVYDLHSLRVAGVSMLLDAGLPLGVVASIAGHKSLAMTLHYYRAERETLRLKLHEAFKKIGTNNTMEEIAKRLHQNDDESWLRGSADGFTQLRQNRGSGLLRITTSGICPGACCNTGYIDPERPAHTPIRVPGSRCPLCRYFLYGPAFLPGLAYEYNCLLFEIEKKAKQQVKIRAATIEAEDGGNSGDVWRLRGEDDRLDQETTLDLQVLARLYRMIDECISIINAGGDGSARGVQLVIQKGETVSAVVERVGKFQQLKDFVELAEIMPLSRQSAPLIAELELKDRLLDFLRRNGAECYLAGIPKETARTASLKLARLLERLVPEEDARERLLDGTVKLRELAKVEASVLAQVKEGTHQIGSDSNGPQRLIEK